MLLHGAVRLHIAVFPLMPLDRNHLGGEFIDLAAERVRGLLHKQRVIISGRRRQNHLRRDALGLPGFQGMIIHPFRAVALFADHNGAGRREMCHGRRLIIAQEQVNLLGCKRPAVHYLRCVGEHFPHLFGVQVMGVDIGIDIGIVHERQRVGRLAGDIVILPGISALGHLHQAFRQGGQALITGLCEVRG